MGVELQVIGMSQFVCPVVRTLVFCFASFLLISCSRQEGPNKNVDVEASIRALKSTDANERADAAATLASAGSKASTAVPSLIEALKDADRDVRRLAAYALGEIGPKAVAAVPALKEMMSTERDR